MSTWTLDALTEVEEIGDVMSAPAPFVAPESVAKPAPKKKAAPAKAKPAKKPTTTEAADVQIIVYMTKSEAADLDQHLDGRPRSGYLRKKIVKMVGDSHD